VKGLRQSRTSKSLGLRTQFSDGNLRSSLAEPAFRTRTDKIHFGNEWTGTRLSAISMKGSLGTFERW
jgi:hypothetical protein